MSEEITLLTVYDRLAKMDTKLDAHVAGVNERLRTGSAQMEDHEKRLRQLEKLASKLIGAFVVIDLALVLVEWWMWAHK